MTAGVRVWEEPLRERLERELAEAESALVEAEVILETLRVEVDNLAAVHHQRLGPVYQRLDELDARIAELVAARSGDPEDARRAAELRERAEPLPPLEELAEEAGVEVLQPRTERVRPSGRARELYRELARSAHPDLTQDPAERSRRDAFIARVNDAYSRDDVLGLEALREDWAAGPDAAPPPEETARRMEWLVARLEVLRRRLDELDAERRRLDESAMGQLISLAPDDPGTLLDEIAERLLVEVEDRERRLAELA